MPLFLAEPPTAPPRRSLRVGDLILPIAAIRGEGTSNDYIPPEIPALPSFRLQKAVSAMIVKHGLDYWTGTIYTTNRRVCEHDETFKNYLKTTRAMGIDMETATIFIVGFVSRDDFSSMISASHLTRVLAPTAPGKISTRPRYVVFPPCALTDLFVTTDVVFGAA